MTGQFELRFDDEPPLEMLKEPEPKCPVCGAEGLEPCGRWTEKESREPNGWPLHRVGSPWVHGQRGQAERNARLRKAGVIT